MFILHGAPARHDQAHRRRQSGVSCKRKATFLLEIALGIDHPMPTGTIAMLALLTANVVLYRRGMLTAAQRTSRASNLIAQMGRER
jgi:hypothetical protein